MRRRGVVSTTTAEADTVRRRAISERTSQTGDKTTLLKRTREIGKQLDREAKAKAADAPTQVRERRIPMSTTIIAKQAQEARSKFPLGTITSLQTKTLPRINKLSQVSFGDRPFDPKDKAFGVSSRSTDQDVCEAYGCEDCPGHFGKIEFPPDYPIYHFNFIRTIIRILKVICLEHLEIVSLDESLLEELENVPMMQRLEFLENKVGKTGVCCSVEDDDNQCRSPKEYMIDEIGKSGTIKYRVSGGGGKKKEVFMPITEVKGILDRLSKPEYRETRLLLGFDKENPFDGFILSYMMVIPSSCRPVTYHGDDQPKESELTTSLRNIATRNKELRDAIRDGSNDIFSKHTALYEAHKTYLTLEGKTLNGKDNYVREDMLGKRGNNAGRAVITPASPHIPLGWIEVPEKFRHELTKEELVTPENIGYIGRLLEIGEIVMVREKNHRVRDLTISAAARYKYYPKVGDVVMRKLRHGDWVILVRQPTIQQQSFTAHRIRIVLGRNTIGIPLSLTPPTNADFDGDEMSLYVLQTAKAIEEAEELVSINRNLISAQSSTPITGLVLNAITFAYLLSTPGARVSIEIFTKAVQALRIRNQLKSYTARITARKLHPLSGKAFLSMLFPADFQYENLSDKDNIVRIVDGILVEGRLSKRTLGPKAPRSIIQALHADQRYGYERTSWFLSDASMILDMWGRSFGFSMSIQDLSYASDPKIMAKFVDFYEGARAYYESLGDDPSDVEIMNAVKNIVPVGTQAIKEDELRRLDKIREIMNRREGYTAEEGFRMAIEEGWADDETVRQDLLELMGNLKSKAIADTIMELPADISGSGVSTFRTHIERILDAMRLPDTEQSYQDILSWILRDGTEQQRVMRVIYFQRAVYSYFDNLIQPLNEIIGMSTQNAFRVMSQSGAKGSDGNSSEIGGTRGMQTSEGECLKRIIHGGRLNCYHLPGDQSLESRGMCKSNYKQGLTHNEYIDHCMSARGDIVKTATTLPIIGEMRRSLSMSFRSIFFTDGMAKHSGTDAIFQFIYGGDGFSPTKLIPIQDKLVFIDIEAAIAQVNSEFGWVLESEPVPEDSSIEQILYPNLAGDDTEDRPFMGNDQGAWYEGLINPVRYEILENHQEISVLISEDVIAGDDNDLWE